MSVEPAAKIQSLNPLAIPRWDEVVARFPAVNAFHSAGWAAVLNRTYGHRLSYWIEGPAESPLAIFPLATVRSPFGCSRGVCLPFVDCCAPLVQPGVCFQPLWDAVRSAGLAAGWHHIEWRGDAPVPGATPSITFHAHVLDLRPGREAVLRGFDSSALLAVRKAESAGLHVRFGTAQEDVDAYYRLHCLTRRRLGLPPHSPPAPRPTPCPSSENSAGSSILLAESSLPDLPPDRLPSLAPGRR